MGECRSDDKDADLVQELRANRFPREALEDLMGRLKHWIYLEHKAFVPEWEDLATCAIEEAYGSIKSFQGDSLFNTWLMGIAANLIRKRYERQKRKPEHSLDEFMETHAQSQEYMQQQQRKAADEQEAQLLKWEIQAFRDSLDERTRRIFDLRYDLGKSSVEIAEIVEERDDNVRAILSRTHKKLMKTLIEHGYTDLQPRPGSRKATHGTISLVKVPTEVQVPFNPNPVKGAK